MGTIISSYETDVDSDEPILFVSGNQMLIIMYIFNTIYINYEIVGKQSFSLRTVNENFMICLIAKHVYFTWGNDTDYSNFKNQKPFL